MEHLRELAENLHLMLSFAKRDIRAKYKQTMFGVAWAVIQPLSLMVVFTFVFSMFARIPSEGVPYPIFSYSVLIFWMLLRIVHHAGHRRDDGERDLVRKIYFPRETLLLAVMISALVDLGIAVGHPGRHVRLLRDRHHLGGAVGHSAARCCRLLVMLTVILVTSSIQVYFRDVGHALPLLMQLWMYATPIAYPLSSVPELAAARSTSLNPMVGIIDGYRRALLHGAAPDLALSRVACVRGDLVLLTGAYLNFKRAERTFADVI